MSVFLIKHPSGEESEGEKQKIERVFVNEKEGQAEKPSRQDMEASKINADIQTH